VKRDDTIHRLVQVWVQRCHIRGNGMELLYSHCAQMMYRVKKEGAIEREPMT
jgi:hypothetical protein